MSTVVSSSPESALELWDELSEQIWQVWHGNAEPRLMTLGEMDLAFQRGDIDACTLVCRVGANDWRSLATIAGVEPSMAQLSFIDESPAYVPAAADDEPSSLAPVASSIDVTDAPDVVVQMDFDLAASPVPAVMCVPDAFSAVPMRSAGTARTSRRRGTSFAKNALGLAAAVTMFGVVFVGVSTFLANAYGQGKADAAFVLARPHLSPVSFEVPEPTLAPPRAAVPSSKPDEAPAPVALPSAPAATPPAPPAKVASKPAAPPAPKGVVISTSERAWDSRKALHGR